MAVVPITARLNTPVDQIGDKALERARRDFQDTVRNNATTNLQPQTQADTGGGDGRRKRGGPAVFSDALSAQVAPSDPRDRVRADANRRARGDVRSGGEAGQNTRMPAQTTGASAIPDPVSGPPPVSERAARPQPDPIGPPIPKELLPQLPTPPPGSSLVAEGLSGRSDLIHTPARGTDPAQTVDSPDEAGAAMQTGPASHANSPQYRLNSEAPPEIAARIAAFMRTGQLDRRPFAVTPVPGLVSDDAAGKPQAAAAKIGAAQSEPVEPVDLLAGFDQSTRPAVMPSLPIPMQAQTIAMMPAGQFAPVRAADHRMPVAGMSQRARNDEEARIRARDQDIAQGSNPLFADNPDTGGFASQDNARVIAGPANPLFAR